MYVSTFMRLTYTKNFKKVDTYKNEGEIYVTQKVRYNAIVDGIQYTIVGTETTEHLDMVTQIVDEQYRMLKETLKDATPEAAAILLAINVMSDYLKKQTENLTLTKKVEKLNARLSTLEDSTKILEKELIRANSAENKARCLLEEIEAQSLKVKEKVCCRN